jgi:hypothetical protein
MLIDIIKSIQALLGLSPILKRFGHAIALPSNNDGLKVPIAMVKILRPSERLCSSYLDDKPVMGKRMGFLVGQRGGRLSER